MRPQHTALSAQVSVETLLSALKAHLQPAPCYSSLPAALTIFANLQLLSENLVIHAKRALQANEELLDDLVQQGVEPTDFENEGALSREEVIRIRKLTEEKDMMFIFSMEMRKHVDPLPIQSDIL
jgi:hypothetical protein